jgi:hypothetical protein
MNDLLSEPPIALTKLAQREGVNCCTTYRWWKVGIKSIRLETYMRAGRRVTSLPAFERFCQRVTVAKMEANYSIARHRVNERPKFVQQKMS